MTTRRRFLEGLAVAGASVGALWAAACGDDDGGGGGGRDGGGGGSCTPRASIGSNHGHSVSVPRADVDAGAERTYDIQGTSSHPHSVTITAAMFTQLQSGRSASATSTTDSGHSHGVTLTCL